MFNEKEANIIKALVEEELMSLISHNDTTYSELIDMYRETLITIANKIDPVSN